MDQYTEDYNCSVIHNNAKSNKLVDQVFWYKLNLIMIKIRKRRSAEHGNEHLNNNSDDEEEYDPRKKYWTYYKCKKTSY